MEPLNDFEGLGSLAAEHQDRRLDELVDLGAARRRFLNASARRTVGTRAKILVAAAAGIAACLALFMFADFLNSFGGGKFLFSSSRTSMALSAMIQPP